MAQFNTVKLYGGAIVTSLPSTFGDVSEIRQVPDNQEVYLDTNGFTSIVFDLLERVDKPDNEALNYHLEDIVDEDANETRILMSGAAHFSKLPQGAPAFTLLATTPPGSKQRGRPNEPDFVGLVVTLVRLEKQNTDIVITINVPHVAQQYNPAEVDPASGRYGPLIEAAVQYRGKIMETFEIKEWGLFGEEQA